jgi:hypothetical protein
MQYIATECAGCGVTFDQPNDPGRKRKYHSDACRQAAYRARTGKTGHEARDEAKRRQEQRRAEDARRARERRARQAQDEARRAGAPWTAPRAGDTPNQAKKRATCRHLMDRANHKNTPPEEAATCRAKAEAFRAKYDL